MSVPQLRYSALLLLSGKEKVKRWLDGIGICADEFVDTYHHEIVRAPAMMVTCIFFVCSLKNDYSLPSTISLFRKPFTS